MTNSNRSDASLERYIQTAISQMGPENQALVQRLLVRRRNKGRQMSTNQVWVQAWKRADKFAAHRPLASLTGDEWASILADMGAGLAGSTLHTSVSFLRAGLRVALGCKDLPPDIDDALCVEAPESATEPRVLTQDDFRLILEHIAHHESRYHSPGHIALKLAIAWSLWDTGFRCDELRSLNVGDVSFTSDGGAFLQLRSKKTCLLDGCRLKTIPRGIYAVECVGPLKMWLALHPRGADPAAPLFLGFRDKSGSERISKQVLNNWIGSMGPKAGLSPMANRASALVPKDFRHTRATRMAREGELNLAKFSMYFWGIPNSKEVATYVHLKAEDLRSMVRNNLGLDDLGYLQHVDAGDDAAALASILHRIQLRQRSVATTRRPGPAQS